MDQASIIGIDLAKHSFQVHGARADGSVAFRKKLSRGKVLNFLASQAPCVVAMEACGSAHHWGREAEKLGHEALEGHQVGSADIREAIRQASEERYGRRGGDHRGSTAPDHELRGREDERAAGQRDAVPYARSSGTPADANDQRAAGPFGGVWRDRTTGACSCQPLGLGARGPVLGATGAGPRVGRPSAWADCWSRREDTRIGEGCAHQRQPGRRGGAPHDDTGGRPNHCDGAAGLRTADGELSARARLLRMARARSKAAHDRRQAQAGQDIEDGPARPQAASDHGRDVGHTERSPTRRDDGSLAGQSLARKPRMPLQLVNFLALRRPGGNGGRGGIAHHCWVGGGREGGARSSWSAGTGSQLRAQAVRRRRSVRRGGDHRQRPTMIDLAAEDKELAGQRDAVPYAMATPDGAYRRGIRSSAEAWRGRLERARITRTAAVQATAAARKTSAARRTSLLRELHEQVLRLGRPSAWALLARQKIRASSARMAHSVASRRTKRRWPQRSPPSAAPGPESRRNQGCDGGRPSEPPGQIAGLDAEDRRRAGAAPSFGMPTRARPRQHTTGGKPRLGKISARWATRTGGHQAASDHGRDVAMTGKDGLARRDTDRLVQYAGAQAEDARCSCAGQQNGAHHLGADDDEGELPGSRHRLRGRSAGRRRGCEKVGGQVRANGQMRRDRENQLLVRSSQTRVADLDPFRVSPYRPAASNRPHQQAE